MDTAPTHQAPRGPMTRARARVIENEVNSLLFDLHIDMHGTWVLPHHGMLCVIRYEEGPNQGAKEPHQVQGEGHEARTEDGGQQLEEEVLPRRPRAHRPVGPRAHGLSRNSLDTPCARAPMTPCARAPSL